MSTVSSPEMFPMGRLLRSAAFNRLPTFQAKAAYASQVAPAITPSKTSILPIATLELQTTADERGKPQVDHPNEEG